MKRLVLLAAVLALVLGMASMAHAATVKATGQWALEFLFSDNFDMNDGTSNDGDGDFNVYQRARTQFDFIANENLKGVLATEIGTTRWGDPDGFHFHDHNATINVRRAYLDFKVPDTTIAVRGGLQGIALPATANSTFNKGSMILDTEMPALVVSSPIIDQVSVLAGYGRLYDYSNTSVSGESNSAFDTGFLAVPVKLDGFKFAPYFVYAYAGEQALNGMVGSAATASTKSDYQRILAGLLTQGASNYGGRNAYWTGTDFTMTYFDPITIMADFAYGSVSSTQGGDENERSGWMFDLAVDYTGLDFMTPEAFFVYTSGEDDKASNGSERMPGLMARNWGIGNGVFFGGDALLKGDHGFYNEQMGFWAAGLSLKSISFLDKLSHDLTAFYAKGTNDEKFVNVTVGGAPLSKYGQTLTEKDHIWEFDLNNSYKLYDELTFMVNMGYVVNGYDKDTWGVSSDADSYKLSTGFMYSF